MAFSSRGHVRVGKCRTEYRFFFCFFFCFFFVLEGGCRGVAACPVCVCVYVVVCVDVLRDDLDVSVLFLSLTRF